jgi:hypothetical protein
MIVSRFARQSLSAVIGETDWGDGDETIGEVWLKEPSESRGSVD